LRVSLNSESEPIPHKYLPKFKFIRLFSKLVCRLLGRFSSRIQNMAATPVSTGSSVRKITAFSYFYAGCQLLISIQTLDKNPKFYYSLLFDLNGFPRWKFLPFGIIESYMSYCGATVLLFYTLLYLAYLRITWTSLLLLRYRAILVKFRYWGMTRIFMKFFLETP